MNSTSLFKLERVFDQGHLRLANQIIEAFKDGLNARRNHERGIRLRFDSTENTEAEVGCAAFDIVVRLAFSVLLHQLWQLIYCD